MGSFQITLLKTEGDVGGLGLTVKERSIENKLFNIICL